MRCLFVDGRRQRKQPVHQIGSRPNCHTQKYETAVVRDFAGLGLKVVWQRCWCRAFDETIDKARTQAAQAGQPFDEAAFIERQRTEETARQMRDDARD
jgi:hypothetical protein